MMSAMTPHLDQLVADLGEAFQANPRGTDAAPLLREYASQHDDWRRYAFFEDGIYTRNLIAANEHFELLLLCWSANQTSPVHNHEGQNCWMAILEGEIEEERFAIPTCRGPLESGSRLSFPRGEVAFIRDEIGLHVVRPVQGRPSVSLHLYAAPIPECNCYCEETGAITRKTLQYYSVRGERRASV